MHCRMLNSISGFYLLDNNCTLPVWMTKNDSRDCQMSPRVQNNSPLRTAGQDYLLSGVTLEGEVLDFSSGLLVFFLAVWPLASYLTSVCFHILTIKWVAFFMQGGCEAISKPRGLLPPRHWLLKELVAIILWLCTMC